MNSAHVALPVLVVTILLSSISFGLSVSLPTRILSSAPGSAGLQVWFDSPQLLDADPCAYQLDVHAQTSGGLWITALHWNFGDGSTLDVAFSAQSVVDDIRTHIYPATGTYVVSVVAYDSAGDSGSAGQTLIDVIPGSCHATLANSLSTISNAAIQQGTDLQLPSGGQLYLYGFATGGDSSSTPFTNGQYVSVTNSNGNLVADLAATTSDSNSYTTQASDYSIAAVSVSGYSSYAGSYVSDSSPGSPGVTDHFTVSTPGSLVVVIALGGDEQCLNVTGLPGFTVDISNAGTAGQPSAVTIGHAYLNANTYVVTEQTQQCGANQDPSNVGDLIGVFIFQPEQTPSPSPSFRVLSQIQT